MSLPNALVVDTSHSPYTRLRPVPLTAVTLADTFWAPRRRRNHEVVLPAQYHLLEETGRVDNLRRAAGSKTGIPFQGRYPFNDSDVYKWLEAAAWTLAWAYACWAVTLTGGRSGLPMRYMRPPMAIPTISEAL